jgi:alkyldihydroxyacetonephosphate synthase
MGQDLERDLTPYGVCSGHEPDSAEFSTLGGWISTRASGMKKNTYGNIEDIVQNMTLVTPAGTYSKSGLWPRVSNGPDMNHIAMGSEGNIGIITDAVIKVKKLPEVRIYDSILFPDFEVGIQFMHAVAMTNKYPTSIRLIDNTQFQFGQTLKPASNSMLHDFIDAAKKFYVLNIKGFNPEKMAACTLLFEGDEEDQKALHKKILGMASKFGGMAAGAENGMKGYLLTFLIAYVRDFACQHYCAGESFETSCPWSNVSQLCQRVHKRIADEAKIAGFDEKKIWVSFRVTQLYETGAAIYVYFTLAYRGVSRD